MKQYLFPSILMAFGLMFITLGIVTNKRPEKKPVAVEYFKQGQILLPDQSCPDTLIVMDAAGLNKAFAPIEQGISGQDFGDTDYDNLFHQFCKPLNEVK